MQYFTNVIVETCISDVVGDMLNNQLSQMQQMFYVLMMLLLVNKTIKTMQTRLCMYWILFNAHISTYITFICKMTGSCIQEIKYH